MILNMAGPHSPEATEKAHMIVEYLCSQYRVGTVIPDGERQLQGLLSEGDEAPESIRREFPVKRSYGYSPLLGDVLRTMEFGGQLSVQSDLKSLVVQQGALNMGRKAADHLADEERDYLEAAAEKLIFT